MRSLQATTPGRSERRPEQGRSSPVRSSARPAPRAACGDRGTARTRDGWPERADSGDTGTLKSSLSLIRRHVMRIGVTGHMNLTPDTARLVSDALRSHLTEVTGGVTGVSCIARGADSLFADAVLEAGGALEVVLPSRDYRDAKVKPDHAEQFDLLLGKAAGFASWISTTRAGTRMSRPTRRCWARSTSSWRCGMVSRLWTRAGQRASWRKLGGAVYG